MFLKGNEQCRHCLVGWGSDEGQAVSGVPVCEIILQQLDWGWDSRLRSGPEKPDPCGCIHSAVLVIEELRQQFTDAGLKRVRKGIVGLLHHRMCWCKGLDQRRQSLRTEFTE